MNSVEDLPDGLLDMPPSRKGVQRKTEIVDAALRVIGRDGIQGVSMRVVAAEARVPLGTTTYYFKDKETLIAAAFSRHTQRETARVVAAIATLGRDLTPQGVAQRLGDFVIDGLTEHRLQLLTEYEFLAQAARRDDLQRASAAWLQSLQAHLEATVTTLSSPSPRTDARLVLSVLAGLEVDHLGVPLTPAARRVIRATLERLFDGLALLWSAGPRPPSTDRPPPTRTADVSDVLHRP